MSRISRVAANEVPQARRVDMEARATRRGEREEFRDALLALSPGEALRIDGVPANLRPTWRDRMRAVAEQSGRRFTMKARGETVWFTPDGGD